MKLFIIRPIRGKDEDYLGKIESRIELFKKNGHEIYDPIRDTDQDDSSGLELVGEKSARGNRQIL